MCGRYTRRARELGIEVWEDKRLPWIPPRFNIAPTQDVPAIRFNDLGSLEMLEMHWWLIPAWAKKVSHTYPMFNARAETVRSKPAFRTPFKTQRCLIPADGWYEWKEVAPKHKQPYFLRLADDRPFCFAGLWDYWESKDGTESVTSCTIITTEANKEVSPVHHRMPVILRKRDYQAWLDPQYHNLDRIEQLLAPYTGRDIEPYRVSPMVNRARVDDPKCIERIDTDCVHCGNSKKCFSCRGKGKKRWMFSATGEMRNCTECGGTGQCYECVMKPQERMTRYILRGEPS